MGVFKPLGPEKPPKRRRSIKGSAKGPKKFNMELDQKLRCLKQDIDARRKTLKAKEANLKYLIDNAEEHYVIAVDSYKNDLFNDAWIAIHDAEECLIQTESSEALDSARIRVLGLVQEIGAVAELKWAKERVRTMKNLLCSDSEFRFNKLDVKEKRRRLREALELRNDYWDRKYREALIVQESVKRLAGTLLMITVLIVFVAFLGWFPALETTMGILDDPGNPESVPRDWSTAHLLVAGALFGALGGGLSSILIVATTLKHIVTDHVRYSSWHIMRPLVGAATGIAAIAVVAGGFGLNSANKATYLAVATAAGFSESFLEGLVSRFTGKRSDSGQPPL